MKNEEFERYRRKLMKIVKRGYDPQDKRWFSKENLRKLKTAQEEVIFLLDRGYKLRGVMDLVGGKHGLSKKQRMALTRATASTNQIIGRRNKELMAEELKDGELYIDGFNLIITLEVALSNCTIIRGNDGVVRDLAGLRGTYKVVDKTLLAADLIFETLEKLGVTKTTIFLDEPVSNSGQLKKLLLEKTEEHSVEVEVEIVRNPDVLLMEMDRVVSADAVIIDSCLSWFNMSSWIIHNLMEDVKILEFNSGE